jgi:hypothetical protein
LNRDGDGQNAAWSMVDAEGGVYQIGPGRVRFPPAQAGGASQTVAITPAELVRNVGIASGVDSSRVEALIGDLGLPDTIDTATAAQAQKSRSVFTQIPSRETALAIAAGAILLASLTYLLWSPGDRGEMNGGHR